MNGKTISDEGRTTMTTAPSRFRKKPVEIEAIQWTGSNLADVQAFTGAGYFGAVAPEDRAEDPDRTAEVYDTLHSTWVGVYDGQWVIRGVKGEFYPCAPDVLAETYASAETAETPPDAWEPARYSLDGYAREHLILSWREVPGRGLVVIGADMAETELRTARDAEMFLAGLASAECAIHTGKATP